MKNFPVIFILLIITALSAYSQNKKDVIYLKNGSIINGTISEITDSQYKVKTTDGSLIIFNSSEIDRYTTEEAEDPERRENGIGFSLEGGFLVGPQSTDYNMPFSFNAIGSYTVNTKNVFGIGTGSEFLGKTYTPLFFEYKGYLTENKVAPFLFFRGGVLLFLGDDDESNGYYYPQYNLVKEYSGGGSFTAGTGISWVKSSFETYLSFAYRYAHTSYKENNYNGYPVTYNNNYNRLEIKFGFKF